MRYDTECRLPYLSPETLTPEQKAFYDANVQAMQPMPYVWMTPGKDALRGGDRKYALPSEPDDDQDQHRPGGGRGP